IDQLSLALAQEADVVIEFTRPAAALQNVLFCLNAGVPVVSGTTGWTESLPEAKQFCLEKKGAFLWASNFSVGVNLFFALNRRLAQMMSQRPEYQVSVAEWHHMHKLDAPSGTALTLLQDLLSFSNTQTNWELNPAESVSDKIPVTAFREGEIPGTHQIRWESPIDSITLEHKAHSRAGFATGAVLAAKWLKDKKGVFDMADVLGIS
ncbi:MAG: 4-hydroxy-tetrahydrodipicolinate reductase, partial [Bacteroidetes bacterium]|nr:4-hydroxy-tetrahydrodipicolinate reductase [Bacteroidota bacterium]